MRPQNQLLRAAALAAGVALLSIMPLSATSADCKVGPLLELPVSMNGLKPMIQSKINGSDVQLIADSGAFFSLLSPASAASLHLPRETTPLGFYLQGVGGAVAPYLTTVKELSLGGTSFKGVKFLVGGSETGSESVGVLGQNILDFVDTEYDFGRGRLRLLQAVGCSKTNLAYWSRGMDLSIVDLDFISENSKATISSAYVNGVKLRVELDSGSEESLITERAARHAGIRTDGPDVQMGGAIHGLGRYAVRSWIVPIKSFRVGGEEVRNTRLRVADLDLASIDMFVGADFFLSHHILVANSQHRLYITYNGGPVFKLPEPQTGPPAGSPTTQPTPPAAASAEAAADAASFARQGDAESARHDYEHAISDLTRACELEPQNSDYFLARSRAYSATQESALAVADLQHSIELNSNNVTALFERAQLRRAQGDATGAITDLDAIDRIVPKEADIRSAVGELYGELDRLDAAIAQFDQWIPAHPDDVKLARTLTDRCWFRVLGNRDLDKALDDCERADSRWPKVAVIVGGRGWVRLRLGQFDKALNAFNTSLKLVPKEPWSLYGRGVAEIRKGSEQAGLADIRAALALRPDIEQEAKKYGMSP
jgi:tetratricopeptide (TPR) repeat protein/predicted aspartyl protease